jgi:hypothetical protein
MEPIEWIVAIGIAIIIGIFVFRNQIRDWIFGGTNPRPNVLRVGQSPAVGPAPPAGTTFVAELTDGNGNPMFPYDVQFMILPGDDGNVTSVIDGSATVPTGSDGRARVVVKGNDDGADILRATVGQSEATVGYETLRSDP